MNQRAPELVKREFGLDSKLYWGPIFFYPFKSLFFFAKKP